MASTSKVVARVPGLARFEAELGPAAGWAGRCYAVSAAAVDRGLVSGVAVYGHFLGKISPRSYFASRRGWPFVRHGWVRLPDGRVLDLTRWTFTGRAPYVYAGRNRGEYDEGGNECRARLSKPAPTFDSGEEIFHLGPHDLGREAWGHVDDVLEEV